MPSDTVILVAGLGKKYNLLHQSERARYKSLRDVLAQKLRLTRRPVENPPTAEEFWALSEVSFDVTRGEVLGVIGRNGAGKSTLLKLVSRITEPTTGRIILRGRVGSLLEVGTGFHPELTGRENIFLNGAILGMTRAEVRRRFDEIVEFADVERFLDTPVKRYSSGMYVRLAFAVAAHLEPDILIVDEVLAVGDAGFQKKCLGKMQDVAQSSGRTVVFVSHNLAAVRGLCSRVLLLGGGKVITVGSPDEVCKSYLEATAPGDVSATVDLSAPSVRRRGDGAARLRQLALARDGGDPSTSFRFGEPMNVHIDVASERGMPSYVVGFSICTLDGQALIGSNHYDCLPSGPLAPGYHSFTCVLDEQWLRPGRYTVTVAITHGDQSGPADFVEAATAFDIENMPHNVESTASQRLLDLRPAYIRRPQCWFTSSYSATTANDVSLTRSL